MLRFLLGVLALISPLIAADQPAVTPPAPQVEVEQMPPSDIQNFNDVNAVPISYKGAFTKMMVTLLALVVLIVISVWMLRRISQGRFRQMNSGRSIKVLERRPLSPKSALYIVEVGNKKVVIAESQLEVRAITVIDDLLEEKE